MYINIISRNVVQIGKKYTKSRLGWLAITTTVLEKFWDGKGQGVVREFRQRRWCQKINADRQKNMGWSVFVNVLENFTK